MRKGELQEKHSKGFTQIYGERVKYKGFLRGGLRILKDEGLRGLYKG